MASRAFLAALAAAVLIGSTASPLCPAAEAQTYPNHTIKMIVPFAAGGPADTMARIVANRLQTALGQSVILDNRPGAGGTLGAKAAVAADPDGYTLMYANTATLAVGPAVYANIGYDPLTQFAPVALVAVSNNILVMNPAFPANSVQELIAYTKAHPGEVNFASPGHGTPPHMVGELFKQRAGIDIVHVPYKGTAAALTDIMSGQMQMTLENPSVLVPLIHDHKLKALAVTGEARNPQIPDVPTMIEAGLPGFVSMSFTGLLAPAGTPPDIVRRLNADVNAGLRSPDMAALLDKLGVMPRPGSPEDFAAFLKQENELWSAVAKGARIRVE